jgi:hypothetical protein
MEKKRGIVRKSITLCTVWSAEFCMSLLVNIRILKMGDSWLEVLRCMHLFTRFCPDMYVGLDRIR